MDHSQRRTRLSEIGADAETLRNRISANQTYGREDLGSLVLRLLGLREGEAVLDVGCGTGIHLLEFAARVGFSGSAVGLDLDATALDDVRGRASQRHVAVDLVHGSMDEVSRLVEHDPFDAACCSYALYYASEPISVLEQIVNALSPDGRLVIAGPHRGNNAEMLNLCADAGLSAQPALDPGFMDSTVYPTCQRLFSDVKAIPFVNVVTYPTLESFLDYWRSSAYYEKGAEQAMAAMAHQQFLRTGTLPITKRGLVIYARSPR